MSKVTMIRCDICEEEMASEMPEGLVRYDTEEIRFNICATDIEKLFGPDPETHPRRGRKPAEVEVEA